MDLQHVQSTPSAEVVEARRRAAPRTFEEFVTQWEYKIRTCARNFGFNSDQTDDWYQDFLESMYRGRYIEQYDPTRAQFSSYIYTQIQTRLKNERRRMLSDQRLPTVPLTTSDEMPDIQVADEQETLSLERVISDVCIQDALRVVLRKLEEATSLRTAEHDATHERREHEFAMKARSALKARAKKSGRPATDSELAQEYERALAEARASRPACTTHYAEIFDHMVRHALGKGYVDYAEIGKCFKHTASFHNGAAGSHYSRQGVAQQASVMLGRKAFKPPKMPERLEKLGGKPVSDLASGEMAEYEKLCSEYENSVRVFQTICESQRAVEQFRLMLLESVGA